MIKYAMLSFPWFCIITASLTGAQSGSIKALPPSVGHEIIKLKSETGREFPAAFFGGTLDQVAVFVPGAVFDKESWFDLSERLQRQHIAALSLDGKTKDAVWAAVDFLKDKGFKHVALVGGSMGGGAILDALESRTDECISKIILLAPAGGSPVRNPDIHKLFIVSKEDRLGLYSDVKNLYLSSSDPKDFVEFGGSEHAQHLFNTPQKEDLIALILDFIFEGD